jgi:hypothetical protein
MLQPVTIRKTQRNPQQDDSLLGPQINYRRLIGRLAELNITLNDLAVAAGLNPGIITRAMQGERRSLRVRYRIAWVIDRAGLDPEGKIISGDDGFVDYTPTTTGSDEVDIRRAYALFDISMNRNNKVAANS